MVGEGDRCTLKYRIIIKKNGLNQPFCSVFHSKGSDNKTEASHNWSSTVRSEAVKSWFSDCTFTLKKGIDFVQQRKKGKETVSMAPKKSFNILLVNDTFW